MRQLRVQSQSRAVWIALLVLAAPFLTGCTVQKISDTDQKVRDIRPLTIGESFDVDSKVLGESRHINVFVPTMYGQKFKGPLPVLYVLDGGMDEDFLHIAGLAQVLVSNETMTPHILIGVQNTQRRHDLTSPSTNEGDKKIAPVIGGSGNFRRFLKDELFPAVRARYRVTEERAIIGESLAGLFVLETYFREPDLFNDYIAIDPSLFWCDNEPTYLAANAPPSRDRKTVFFASSNEPSMKDLVTEFVSVFESHRQNVQFYHVPFPNESHATIYHPAAIQALRTVFATK